MTTRRSLIASAPLLLAGLPTAARAVAPRDAFEQLVGASVTVWEGTRSHRAMVTSVAPGPFDRRAEQFVVSVRGPQLAEGTYVVAHPSTGRVAVHLRPGVDGTSLAHFTVAR